MATLMKVMSLRLQILSLYIKWVCNGKTTQVLVLVGIGIAVLLGLGYLLTVYTAPAPICQTNPLDWRCLLDWATRE